MEMLIWPGVVLLLIVVFLIAFRRQIGEKIGRVAQLGRSGVTFTSSDEKKAIQVSARDVSDLFGSNDSRLLIEVEKYIKNDLANQTFPSEQEKIDYLIRHLALSRLYQEFEQCYARVFGSQIFLLKRLNEVLGIGRDVAFIKDHFEQAQKIFAPAFDDWSSDTYMRYLFDNSLVTQRDNAIHITIKGIGFLVWLTKAGRNESKGL
jgi:hypothetical protein